MAEDLLAPPLYLDTSVVVRATLESGLTPEVERRIADAPVLITSRLSLVEASRAIQRARIDGRASEVALLESGAILGDAPPTGRLET